MATYKTPDVYIEEISLFPPSVAEVETAVPAFIGYTEKAVKDGVNLTMEPTKLDSLVEFQQYFGGAPPVSPTVSLDETNNVTDVDLGSKKFYLYNSLRLFFDNGGGKCYIVSVGNYNSTPALGDDTTGILGGLKKLEKEDEPTMILSPDAVLISAATSLYSFQQQALKQCSKLQDRVVICDLKNSGSLDTDVQEFRDNIGINSLKYGAAYVPWLKTNYAKKVYYRDISLKRSPSGADIQLANLTKDSAIKNFITNELDQAISAVNTIKQNVINDNLTGNNKTLKEQFDNLIDTFDSGTPYAGVDDFQGAINNVYNLLKAIVHGIVVDVYNSLPDTTNPAVATKEFKLRTDLGTIISNNNLSTEFRRLIYHHNAPIGFAAGGLFTEDADFAAAITALNTITGSTISDTDNDAAIDAQYAGAANANAMGMLARNAAVQSFGSINAAVNDLLETATNYETGFDSSLADMFGTYKTIVSKINEGLNELPSCGAIAGVYATTDRLRGVWKAPANVSLASVVGPSVKIDSSEQEDLNVDVNAGKSINAIRAFTGRGTLVWGARTLAGNDNEWRYISVRRFFNMVEESVKKSTYWAVFEPNDANTWIKVKSMIENYLIQKWRDGALQGAKPEQAFFVKVGLGITMTAQDILEGRMNVQIGMAVVRPAEFIILQFSHKMMES